MDSGRTRKAAAAPLNYSQAARASDYPFSYRTR
jgi:hypothetical protein